MSQSNSLRKLGKPCESRTRELSFKFRKVDAEILWHQDSYSYCGCGCCDMYDDDHLHDSYYEWEYEYLKERSHMFYENINSLKHVFTSEFISRVKEQKLGRLDVLKVFLEITPNDLVDGYNSTFLKDLFDESNKYGLKLEASISYADYDFTKVNMLDIHIDFPFDLQKDQYGHYPVYSFNIYFMKNINMDSKRIKQIYKKIENNTIPEWCKTNEERIMYVMLMDRQFKKILEVLDIQDIIKSLDSFEVFKMYIN